MAKEMDLLIEISETIKNLGGRVFLVGGYVRDLLTKKVNKDIDVEIFGITKHQLKMVLSKFGEVDEIGSSFGIYMVHGIEIDFALPRREMKAKILKDKIIIPCSYETNIIDEIKGQYQGYEVIISTEEKYGHRDFIVVVDPFMSLLDASKRRDFTINGIYKDCLTGEIIDFWNGVKHIEQGLIRHIDDKTFVEDPLRVFRGCQFASRFAFRMADETFNLCKEIDLSTLPKERVYEELKKALLKSDKPSIAFELMRKLNIISRLFPELDKMIDCPQNPQFHPEKDVFEHTMMVIDEASILKDKSSDSEIFMWTALLHDIGKPKATKLNEDGKITSYSHDVEGVLEAKSFLLRITNESRILDGVCNMVKNHMRPFTLYPNGSDSAIRRLSVDTNINDIVLFSEADNRGRAVKDKDFSYISKWYAEKIKLLGADKKIEAIVGGKDLIPLGFKPGKEFKIILDFAFELQLDGNLKNEIIEKILKNYTIFQ